VSSLDRKFEGKANEIQRFSGHHLNQIELARRWRLSHRTLERWRWLDQGPTYLKIGGRVVYRLEDVEAYETIQRHDLT
jgi:hypothetical protein